MSITSSLTTKLSVALCDGSSRRLIAGWWYFILFTSTIQIFVAMWALSSRGGAQAFITTWSAVMLIVLCMVGTIIMRKFHNSVFVGAFLGAVVAASQMFFLLFLIFLGFIDDRVENGMSSDGERLTSFVCLVQSLMLASFAALLAGHRSEILDQKISLEDDHFSDGGDASSYEPPKRDGV
mmetsp:Transcript_8156/g.16990  ORF Transcript_8156/g.16990 Transcript_8156/m.16990 type:complete len:180 (-) Transcript_8156:116-655(-)